MHNKEHGVKLSHVWIPTTRRALQHSIVSTAKTSETLFIFRRVFERPPDCPAYKASYLIFRQHLPFPRAFSFLLGFDVWWYLTQLWCSTLLHVFPFDLFIGDHLIGVASGSFRVCIPLCFCMLQWPVVIWAPNFPTQHKAVAVATWKSNNHEYSLPHLFLTSLPFSHIF